MIPNSEIYLCSNVPISSNYNHSLWFPDKNTQVNYYMSHMTAHFGELSYIRSGRNSLKIEVPLSNVINCNYMMFINGNYENKYFFAFINAVNYINDTTTEIIYAIDWVQTYITELSFGECFIERSHVSNDRPYSNLTPEGLTLGDYICNARIDDDFIMQAGYSILIEIAPDGATYVENYNNNKIGRMWNVASGLFYYAFTLENLSGYYSFLDQLQSANRIDAITSVSLVPSVFVSTEGGQMNAGQSETLSDWIISGSRYSDTLDGYIPKNKKLLSFPYRYASVENNAGSEVIYKFENLTDTMDGGRTINMQLRGVGGGNPSIACYPKNGYAGDNFAWNEKITLEMSQACPYYNDVYKAWLVQTKASREVQALGIGVGVVSNLLNGQIGSAIQGGVMGSAQMLAQQEQAKTQPNQAKGGLSTSLNIGASMTKFTFKYNTIRYEYAKRIDDYFTMYGYNISDYAVPNLHVRENFTYIKTNNCVIKNAMPNVSRETIENVINNGCTFWVGQANGVSHVGDYSLSNQII